MDVFDTRGSVVKTCELDGAVFDGKVNTELMHQAVTIYLGNQRKGLAQTKTRTTISGGGKKPWRQKGTGRARVGSNRSPLWRKGAVTFGPHPHSFRKAFPKKMSALALRSALNSKWNDQQMLLLDELRLESAKTKAFNRIVENLKLAGQRVKFILESIDENIKRASRNMPGVTIARAHDAHTIEILDCKKIVFTTGALRTIEERVKQCLH